ncbi:MAG: hypothetical protein RL069_1400 [Planctomycetota bacterium]|jgi:hypothetical protein
MDVSNLPEYHIESSFDPARVSPRGYSDIAKVMETNSAQLLRDVLRPPGGLASYQLNIDDYEPTPAVVVEKRKVRFRHGAEPKHFPIVGMDDTE